MNAPLATTKLLYTLLIGVAIDAPTTTVKTCGHACVHAARSALFRSHSWLPLPLPAQPCPLVPLVPPYRVAPALRPQSPAASACSPAVSVPRAAQGSRCVQLQQFAAPPNQVLQRMLQLSPTSPAAAPGRQRTARTAPGSLHQLHAAAALVRRRPEVQHGGAQLGVAHKERHAAHLPVVRVVWVGGWWGRESKSGGTDETGRLRVGERVGHGRAYSAARICDVLGGWPGASLRQDHAYVLCLAFETGRPSMQPTEQPQTATNRHTALPTLAVGGVVRAQ